MDYRKAFDSVPHLRLLSKLYDLGVRGKVLKWIEAFLCQRRQRVVVNGSKSDWSEVSSGIPQGSVLGPTLFVLFINDLPNCVTSTIKLFADDAKLYRAVSTSDDSECLQKDLDALANWTQKWLLPFNTSKCSVLHLGSGNPKVTYNISGVVLEQASVEKDLGVLIDEQLKFREQAAAAVTKANRILGLIRHSFVLINRDTLPVLYTTGP